MKSDEIDFIGHWRKTVNTHSDEELLVLYLQKGDEEFQPSAKLLEKLDRLQACSALARQYGSRFKVIKMMTEIDFKKADGTAYRISESTAYTDYSSSQRVFGSVFNNDKDYWMDVAMGNILESRAKALKRKDFRSVSAENSNMIKLIAMMPDKNSIPWDKIKFPDVIIGFYPEKFKTFQQLPEDWEERVKKTIEKKQREVYDITPIQKPDERDPEERDSQ